MEREGDEPCGSGELTGSESDSSGELGDGELGSGGELADDELDGTEIGVGSGGGNLPIIRPKGSKRSSLVRISSSAFSSSRLRKFLLIKDKECRAFS